MITYHFQNDEETFDAMTELTLRVNPTKRAMVAERILDGAFAIFCILAAVLFRIKELLYKNEIA